MPAAEIWTAEQARAYFAKGKKLVSEKKKPTGAKQKWEMQMCIQLLGFTLTNRKVGKRLKALSEYKPGEFVEELTFSKSAGFRFDWAIPTLKIAVEYEGIARGGKSRHTTLVGYTKDTDKYNLAAVEGWIVLRFTAKNYKTLPEKLKNILNQKTI